MNIFVVGFHQSGKTSVAKTLSEKLNINYIDATFPIINSFKPSTLEKFKYQEEYNLHLCNLIKNNPTIVQDYINKEIKLPYNVIDGIISPKDFLALFNYNQDMVIFLNRLNNDNDLAEYEKIGLAVIRDYCYWLASINLLDRNRWLEYNFQIPGEDLDSLRVLGSKNTVLITKSIKKVIHHLYEILSSLISA